ncbi:MAG: UDP-N-acetylmuramate dehydrogenase [Clostridiales bacterium]|jgi:UDP-N-acetylmuramate dehydrogenase|nr:UDP-N-acetylmuramate dehydrogenase [Clostridiales bacterium]
MREGYDFLTTVGVKFKSGVKGGELTSFKSGGITPLVFYPETSAQFVRLMSVLDNTSLKYKLLGAGTNTLIGDGGFDGVIVTLRDCKGFSFGGDIIEACAGVSLPQLAAFAAKDGLSGLEFACGIPGTVGGGIYMNAGAYGADIAGALLYAEIFDIGTKRIERYSAKDLDFGYRTSHLQGGGLTVLKAAFKLNPSDIAAVKLTMSAYAKKRAECQPREPSLGSVFKRTQGVIPALLIDKAGLKGYNVGGAFISEKHAGFIINKGGAASSDYISLMQKARLTVKEMFGAELMPEIEII